MALPISLLRFSYQSFHAEPIEAFPQRRVVFRPVIDVRLLWNNESTRYRVLIDSGADFCIFHSEVADVLKIPVTSGKRLMFYGTGGTPQTAYFHNVHIEVGGWLMELYCGFSWDMQSLPYGLLGQTGFFDRFKIEFDYQSKRVELKPRR